ncbi:MAG: hypothetical protein ACQEQG_06385 [Bacillota bacterium]
MPGQKRDLGHAAPRASNETERGRAKNRRVELVKKQADKGGE